MLASQEGLLSVDDGARSGIKIKIFI
jgi:hypothetical protein